ncbi:hypothetical protein OAH85_01540 [Paracoccaceae bacterium]|jgi:hypothetical protein|nr:hypothetical protein [Paracoccaceae bacterium]WQC63750.1 hypothetical protein UM181_03810 [Alphaproteobacteria bacterium US3C007]MCH1466919.1 hypothetical protein [Paracoccaceae bacterium]MDA9944430.1 hypothetical protein [Paracoccaceae bacterium]MDB4592182.1 hypothetical protein [Paracoccaceae bacterium]|tara:strand:- start:468 stop:743 length:276 start_codon:yes stop_codon:yes gene_type:complete
MSTINGIAAGAYAQQQASQESQARIQDSRVADTIVEKSQSLKQDTSVLVEISRAARVLAQQKLADARQGAAQQDAALQEAAVARKAERSPV